MSAAGQALPPEQFVPRLETAASRFKTHLPPATISALSAYLAELDRWRRHVNLTGTLSAEELADHVMESLAGSPLVPDRAELLDIGSGAGVPGIPLAVLRPDIRVTLLEPRRKRMAFLQHVRRVLALENLFALEGRTERLADTSWNVATTRAVGGLSSVVGAGTFLTPGGLLLVWTTSPDALAASLAGRFHLEKSVPVPVSRRKQIAMFRRQ
jgi:16S rRNA (guanine527-N7)-methyltransferase